MKKELQKIVDNNKVLWTDWELFGKSKMRRNPNKSAKWLFEQAILEAYKLGLDFCGKIINPSKRKV